MRTTTLPDFGDVDAIETAGLLLTYNSQLSPGEDECEALRRFLDRGGRWLAMHASNSVPDGCPLPGVIGSRFISHPPYRHFEVSVSNKDNPLVAGIDAFELDDELYVMDLAPDVEVLLETRWGGELPGGRIVEEDRRPLMYRRRVGEGEVVYVSLGHCNRPHDRMPNRTELLPDRRGPWALPVFRELVSRGVGWAVRQDV